MALSKTVEWACPVHDSSMIEADDLYRVVVIDDSVDDGVAPTSSRMVPGAVSQAIRIAGDRTADNPPRRTTVSKAGHASSIRPDPDAIDDRMRDHGEGGRDGNLRPTPTQHGRPSNYDIDESPNLPPSWTGSRLLN